MWWRRFTVAHAIFLLPIWCVAAPIAPPVVEAGSISQPGDNDARISRIVILLRQDDWRRALTAAQAAAQKYPQSGDVLGVYALALARSGNIKEADQQVARALERGSEDYWALVAAGRMARWHRRGPEARNFLSRATKIRPTGTEALLWLLVSRETDSAAVETARTYIRLKPSGYLHEQVLPTAREIVRKADAPEGS